MKQILLLISIIMLFASGSKAQVLAFNEESVVQNNNVCFYNKFDSSAKIYKYHKRGYGGMITGEIIMAAGGVVFLGGSASNSRYAILPEILGAVIVGVGFDVFLASSIVFIVSRNNSGSWRKRYSIIGNKYQVGLAYNF